MKEKMGKNISLLITLVLLFSCSFFSTSVAQHTKRTYIVYLGGHRHGTEASQEDYQRATESHYDFLESFIGKEKARNSIFYSYTRHINGFAAILDDEVVMQLEANPDVISVIPNEKLKLHTTRSWHLMGLERDGRVPALSSWTKANFGSNSIIGTLDTGVWPESKSFTEAGMEPVPAKWKGACENNTKNGVICNRKLIGAKYFNQGLMAATGHHQSSGQMSSARDTEGHGTHTLSTAAGAFVSGANLFGYANGTAKGGSPYARAAAYKVCWPGGCYSADIIAGFDEAIHDGVDVLSVSLGGSASDFLTDPIAVGSFHAVAAGITVVCSAGNEGPLAATISNTAPWLLTVGASTMDREFPSYLTLGNNRKIKGESLSGKTLPAGKSYPLINSENAAGADVTDYEAKLCYPDSLDPKKVKGKIVVCLRGDNSRTEKGEIVQNAGGVGMVLVNDEESGDNLIADPHLLPATNIAYADGTILQSYMNSTKLPVAQISAPTTALNVKPAPVMAAFSSRGPGLITPQILKPDITAPGVSVLAAYTEAEGPTGSSTDQRHVPFTIMSGTSMSCPHVSGVVGLLKTMYPDWSPSAIRSAIMTTARIGDNNGKPIQDYGREKATPFAYGSGHIQPNRALDPGLVYDITVEDYLNFLCAFGYNSSSLVAFTRKSYKCPAKPVSMDNLNYPSITVADLKRSRTVTRRVKNVGSAGNYKVRVENPFGVSVTVKPETLEFRKTGEEKTFEVTVTSQKRSIGVGYVFGRLIWTDGKHYVRSPIVVNSMS